MQILQYAPGRWIVEGSKGVCYHVKRFYYIDSGGQPSYAQSGVIGWMCDCPGSIYRGKCRHIDAVKLKELQDLADDTIRLIDVTEAKLDAVRIATSKGKA